MFEDEGELELDSVFPEPERSPTPPPTTASYTRESLLDDNGWHELTVTLVGKHPLWGHMLWNAARACATYLDEHRELYQGKRVLELGAGAGLPGIVTILNGSTHTVLTDYPDQPLIEVLRENAKRNVPPERLTSFSSKGYVWGKVTQEILDNGHKFDLIIMSDLIFNHSQHGALLKTCDLALSTSANSKVIVFYSHHVPKYAGKDDGFFELAREQGWTSTEVLQRQFTPMFPDDDGDLNMRSTVHGWILSRS